AVKSKLPVLAEVASVIGDPAVRNKGTIGGALAHADPAADWPAAMIALGAEMVCEGPKGKRKVGVDQWFLGLMATALKERELLAQVRVPLLPAGSGAAYMKFPHPASRFAVVGVTRTRSEEHTSELQSRFDLVCRLLLEKKNKIYGHTGI